MTDSSSTHPDRRRGSAASQLLIGVLIIVVGLLFTLENLGVPHATQYLSYWPAGLIAIGLVKLWDSREGHGGGAQAGADRARRPGGHLLRRPHRGGAAGGALARRREPF